MLPLGLWELDNGSRPARYAGTSQFTFLGFPLGFYMSAQGSLIIYVVIIGVYAWYMNKLEVEYGVDEGDE